MFRAARPGIVAFCLPLLVLHAFPRSGGAHGIEFRARGAVTAVGGTTLPSTLTIDTLEGPLTLAIDAAARFELDDPEPVAAEAAAAELVRPKHGGHGEEEDEQEAAFRADLGTLVGRFVTATYERESQVIEQVEVESTFELFGRVTRVRGSKVTVGALSGADVVLTADASSRLSLDGAPTADLRGLSGLLAHVQYDPHTLAIHELGASTTRRSARGILDSVEPGRQLLVVRTDREYVSLLVTPGSDLNQDHQDAVLTGMAPGSLVLAQYSTTEGGERVAEHVEAVTRRIRSLSGRVQGLLDAGHTVAVRSGGRTLALKLNAGTTVVAGGRPAAFHALKAGRQVRATYVLEGGLAAARKLVVEGGSHH